MDDDAHAEWVRALRLQTDTRDDAQTWRQKRTSFAVSLGNQLTETVSGKVEISSSQPVVYGVWLSWGVLYVGQTLNGRRRMRDLPIGESHHLSNTFPPEIWAKVGVVAWQMLPGGQEAADGMGAALVGKCLEYLSQRDRNPLVNAAARNRVGDFMPVDHASSRSVAALRSGEIADLYSELRTRWDQIDAAADPTQSPDPAVRIVFPGSERSN